MEHILFILMETFVKVSSMKTLESQWRQQHGRLSYLEGFLFPPNDLEVHAGTQAPLKEW